MISISHLYYVICYAQTHDTQTHLLNPCYHLNVIVYLFTYLLLFVCLSLGLIVVMADTIPPVIMNCPTDITQNTQPGQGTIAVTWTPPTATDNITPTNQITTVATHSPGQQFPVGTTPVRYMMRDAAGNEATCSFNVNVICELCVISCLYVLF